MKDTRQTSIPMLFLGMALIALGLAGSCSANAHDRPARTAVVVPIVDDDTAVRDTLRVCFSERDVVVESSDCRAIIEVTRNRAAITKRTYLDQLRAYSPEATGQRPPRTVRHGWISTMETSCSEPAGWAAYNAWRAARTCDGSPCQPLPWVGLRRDACVATVDEIRAELARPSARSICTGGRPSQWGGRCDPDGSGLAARNPDGRRVGVCDEAPAHWIRLDCSVDGRGARNQFYDVPRVRRRPPADGSATLPARVARGDQ